MNEIQYVNNTAGTAAQFQLCFNGISAAPVAWNVSAANLQANLETVCGIGNLIVSGSHGDGYTLHYIGRLANTPLPLIQAVGVTGCEGITTSRIRAGTGATAWYDPLNDSSLKGIWYPGFGVMDYAQANFITTNGSSVNCWLSAVNSGAKFNKSSGTVPTYVSATGALSFASTATLNGSVTGMPSTAGAARTSYIRFDPGSNSTNQFPMSWGGTAAGVYGSGKLTTWQIRYDSASSGSPSAKYLGVDCNWDGWGWSTGGLAVGTFHNHVVSYPLNGPHNSASSIKMYYNGVSKATTKSYNFSNVNDASGPYFGRLDTNQSAGAWFYIGSPTANVFLGKLAAIALFSSQLSDADVASLSTTPSVPAAASNPLVFPGRLPACMQSLD